MQIQLFNKNRDFIKEVILSEEEADIVTRTTVIKYEEKYYVYYKYAFEPHFEEVNPPYEIKS